ELHKSTNGGITWEFITDDYEIGVYTRSQLLFLTEEIGFYAGWEVMFDDGKISRTDNGGNTWTKQITGDFFDIDMLNIDTGYAVTDYSRIYKTINGGIPVGITESNISQSKNVTIFPNPLTDRSELKINPDLLVDHCQLSFILYDPKGRKVKQINNIKTSKIEITRGNLSPGIYFYSLIGGNRIIESDKLLIK
ncbi:MAG: T9SS type A sorting domain-containing protein, partial [Bacteroidales bacterium]|nr:T9SS type A sorting domain-containing protein [Bacteroidales bacterium]